MSIIISDIVDYIDSLGGYATVLVDTLSEGEESSCVRAEAGQAEESRYMDGSRSGVFQFAIYCKSTDKQTAIEQLSEYVKKLDLNGFSLNERLNISCEPLTDPHYISILDNGAVIYTASFQLNYFQGV
jgi:hypothetical protein